MTDTDIIWGARDHWCREYQYHITQRDLCKWHGLHGLAAHHQIRAYRIWRVIQVRYTPAEV